MEPLDAAVDHVRGAPAGRLIAMYGDYECPYSRRASGEIAQLELRLGDGVRFAFRHFPLTQIHPHALAAAAAAEAAALQERFWDMHELLFRRQTVLEDGDLRRYAPSSSSTSPGSTATGAAPRCCGACIGTSRARSRRARCWARPRCSSTEPCTAGPMTRPSCSRCWPDERDLLENRSSPYVDEAAFAVTGA
jgi:hypothetical protein